MGWIMKWISKALETLMFFLNRRDTRTEKRVKINQQHRDGINLIIRFNPSEFNSNCQQSLKLLAEAANLAEGFDKEVWKDIKDTANKVHELEQIFGFLNNSALSGLTPERQTFFAERHATIRSCLMAKLSRI